MITSFDRKTVRTINAEVAEALKQIGEKHGLQIDLAGTSFSPTNFTTKFTCAVVDRDGIAQTVEASDYRVCAKHYGITLQLGDSFTHHGHTYTIIGWNSRSKKYPVLATRDGKTYKLATQFVKMHQ